MKLRRKVSCLACKSSLFVNIAGYAWNSHFLWNIFMLYLSNNVHSISIKCGSHERPLCKLYIQVKKNVFEQFWPLKLIGNINETVFTQTIFDLIFVVISTAILLATKWYQVSRMVKTSWWWTTPNSVALNQLVYTCDWARESGSWNHEKKLHKNCLC